MTICIVIYHVIAALTGEMLRVRTACCRACKFVSRQVQSILPLRASSIRRAHDVKIRPLVTILLLYALECCLHVAGSILLVRSARRLPPVLFFELWTLPLDAISFFQLSCLEILHVVEELSHRADLSAPSFWLISPERRAELGDFVKLHHDICRGAIILCHRATMLAQFGFKGRLGDILVLADMRATSNRILHNLELYLRHSLSHINVDAQFQDATKGRLSQIHPA
jgi:hypothetical protein